MRTKTTQRILEETPQEVKDRAIKWAEDVLKEASLKQEISNSFTELITSGSLLYKVDDYEKLKTLEFFAGGANSAKKEYKKTVLDILNAVKSKLAEEETPKLGRSLPNRRADYYSAQKNILEQLLNKLK